MVFKMAVVFYVDQNLAAAGFPFRESLKVQRPGRHGGFKPDLYTRSQRPDHVVVIK